MTKFALVAIGLNKEVVKTCIVATNPEDVIAMRAQADILNDGRCNWLNNQPVSYDVRKIDDDERRSA